MRLFYWYDQLLTISKLIATSIKKQMIPKVSLITAETPENKLVIPVKTVLDGSMNNP